jgi:hypothetical protein
VAAVSVHVDGPFMRSNSTRRPYGAQRRSGCAQLG